MERNGYPEWFDLKESLEYRDAAIIQLWELTQKYQEKKKKLTINIIEWLVGGVLLFFCMQYLQQHPAEKVALLSGFEVISQKVHVFFADKSQDLQGKYDLERSFAEVISLAKEWACINETALQEIENRLTALQNMDSVTYENQKEVFMNYLRSQYLLVKKACSK